MKLPRQCALTGQVAGGCTVLEDRIFVAPSSFETNSTGIIDKLRRWGFGSQIHTLACTVPHAGLRFDRPNSIIFWRRTHFSKSTPLPVKVLAIIRISGETYGDFSSSYRCIRKNTDPGTRNLRRRPCNQEWPSPHKFPCNPCRSRLRDLCCRQSSSRTCSLWLRKTPWSRNLKW